MERIGGVGCLLRKEEEEEEERDEVVVSGDGWVGGFFCHI